MRAIVVAKRQDPVRAFEPAVESNTQPIQRSKVNLVRADAYDWAVALVGLEDAAGLAAFALLPP